MDDREIELKLAPAPEDMARIAQSPALTEGRLGAPTAKALHSTYFDTPDFVLAARGIALRVRRTGSGFVQTVKTSGSGSGGLMDRDEWEAPVTSETPDADHMRRTGLPLLADDVVTALLVPVFTTEVERTLIRLGGEDWEIEAALDTGAVTAGDEREALCEVELELKRGRPAHLFALAARVQEAAPARPLNLSKSERGFRLAAGKALAPAKSKAPPLSPDMTVAQAFQTIARACLDHFMTNERCLLAGGPPEAVHQMRVALRRLRSAIKVFRKVLEGPDLDRVRADMRDMLEHLGPARDSEVFLAEIIDPVAAEYPDDDGMKLLRAHWERDRDAKAAAALSAVRRPAHGIAVLNLGRWIETGDWLGPPGAPPRRRLNEPVTDFARRRMDKAVRRLIKEGGESLSRLSPEDRHAIRIRGKQVRYAGEFFAALAPRKQTKLFLAELSELQDALGALNDIAVAGPKLTACGAELHLARAAGLVAGRLQSRRPDLIAEADKCWRRWRAIPQPWRD